MINKVLLVILDGWNFKKNNDSAIFHAKTEFIDSLYNIYNHNILLTHGEHVDFLKVKWVIVKLDT